MENGMTESKDTTTRHGVPTWIQVLVWLALVALLVLVGLGLKNAQTPMAEVGKPIADFKLVFYEGYEHEGASEVKVSVLRGKFVFVNIWASWCKPCEQEAPELEAAWKHYKDGNEVVVFGVDYVDTPSGAKSYLTKFNITFPNAPDLRSSISSILNRNMGVPETYFIDRVGVLKYVKVGPFASTDEIISIIDQMLQ